MYKLQEKDNYRRATFLRKACKQTGRYQHCYNILNESGKEQCLDLNNVFEWKHLIDGTENPLEEHIDKRLKPCNVEVEPLQLENMTTPVISEIVQNLAITNIEDEPHTSTSVVAKNGRVFCPVPQCLDSYQSAAHGWS